MGGPCLDLAELLLGEGRGEGRGTEGTAGVEELQVTGRVLTTSHPGFGARASPRVWTRWIGRSGRGFSTWNVALQRRQEGLWNPSSFAPLIACLVRRAWLGPQGQGGARGPFCSCRIATWARAEIRSTVGRSPSCTALRETHG